MRVRVWINGADGPSHDFELVSAPRIGERIMVVVGGEAEEGVVADVTWHLQAIEPAATDLALVAEPLGAVTMVHVVCRPPDAGVRTANEAAAADLGQTQVAPH